MDSFIKASVIPKVHFKSQKTVLLLILFAIVLRLFLMVSSIHTDFFFVFLFPNLVSHGYPFSVYSLFENELSTRLGFYYTPTVLYFFSIVTYVANLINGDVSKILDHSYTLYKSGNKDPLAFLGLANVNYSFTYLLLKLPYLIFDVGTLVLLLKLVKKNASRKKVFLFWIINPVLLYGTYMYGQFDIIPTFMLTLGIYFAIIEKKYLALFTIGLAATFKNFALVCVLPTALIMGKNKREILVLTVLGFTPFILCMLIVYLQAKSQVIYTLLPKFYIAKNNVSNLHELISKLSRYSLLAVSYIFVLIVAMKLKVNKTQNIIYTNLISLLLLFALTPIILFHYINIVIPILILAFQNNKYLYRFLFGYIATVAIFKLWTPLQQFGLFAPIDNKFLTSAPSLAQVINGVFPYSYVSSISYYLFFILSMTLVIYLMIHLIFTTKSR